MLPIPIDFAVSTAFRTFREFPDVEIDVQFKISVTGDKDLRNES